MNCLGRYLVAGHVEQLLKQVIPERSLKARAGDGTIQAKVFVKAATKAQRQHIESPND